MAVAQSYRVFARREARGRSAAYEALAESVADDSAVVGFIASLPPGKRQPQLMFAAARYLLGAPPVIGSLGDLVRRYGAELTQVIMTRRTQTNEPARCAVLLPVLAGLPQPIALIDVGASAGLTLLFDRYSYDYGGYRLAGRGPDAPPPRTPPPCDASPADRCRCRRGSPTSPGGPGSTSTRLTSPTTTTCAGCPAWSGQARATARSGSRPRSAPPAPPP